MALSKGLKVLNGFQTAGIFVLNLVAAIISAPHAMIVAIPNYIEKSMGKSRYSQENLAWDLYEKTGGNEVTLRRNNTNTYKVYVDFPNPINFPARFFFAIFSPVLFAIIAPFAALKDMFENIIESISKEEGINKLKCIPLLITGLIKTIAAPIRGFADGLIVPYIGSTANTGSATYEKIIENNNITNPVAQVGCGIISPALDVAIKTFEHIYKDTKMFNESNADFLEKRDRINQRAR